MGSIQLSPPRFWPSSPLYPMYDSSPWKGLVRIQEQNLHCESKDDENWGEQRGLPVHGLLTILWIMWSDSLTVLSCSTFSDHFCGLCKHSIVPCLCSLIHSSDYVIQFSDSAVFFTARVLWSYVMIVINIHFSMCPEIFWCSSEEREPSETAGLDRRRRLGFHPARLNVAVVPCAHLPTSAGCGHWALC